MKGRCIMHGDDHMTYALLPLRVIAGAAAAAAARACPGNRRAQKAKAIGEGGERESWSDAGGRWHRGGGAEEARGL